MRSIGHERHRYEQDHPRTAVTKAMASVRSKLSCLSWLGSLVMGLVFILEKSHVISPCTFWIAWGFLLLSGAIFALLILNIAVREHERYVLEDAGIRTTFAVDPAHKRMSGVSPPHLMVIEVVPGTQGLSLGIAKGDVIVRGTLKFDRSLGVPDLIRKMLVMREEEVITVQRNP